MDYNLLVNNLIKFQETIRSGSIGGIVGYNKKQQAKNVDKNFAYMKVKIYFFKFNAKKIFINGKCLVITNYVIS